MYCAVLYSTVLYCTVLYHTLLYFQEARRILTAQWQHVVYSEWLPVLLGPDLVTRLNLRPTTSGYSNTYNQDIDPRISNEFAAAAFR